MRKLFLALLLLGAASLFATNQVDMTDTVLLDGYSDQTTKAWNFADIKGDFIHTYIRNNNIAFVGSKLFGTFKPFVDMAYYPGGASTGYQDMLEEDSGTISRIKTTVDGKYTNLVENQFGAKLRMGLGMEMGTMKLGVALAPILSKNHDAYDYNETIKESVPATQNYTNESTTEKVDWDRNAGSLGIEAGAVFGLFGVNANLVLGGVNNDLSYSYSSTTTDYAWNPVTNAYDPTVTSGTASVAGIDPTNADDNTPPSAMTTYAEGIESMYIPGQGYSSTGIAVEGCYAGMNEGLGILYVGFGMNTRSYDVESASWTGTRTVANVITTAKLTNSWNVKDYSSMDINLRLKKVVDLTDKLTFGLYPRYDLMLSSREASFSLRDETNAGDIWEGETYSYKYSYSGHGLSLPLVLRHQTGENIALFITVKPAVVLLQSSTTEETYDNSKLTYTSGGVSTQYPTNTITHNQYTTNTALWTNYGDCFALFGMNWNLSENVIFGSYVAANAAALNTASVYANLTLHR